ncbi:MAG: deoxyribose-phosphate aldolase [Methanobrevibacter sp.]|nr:deoxyribose-phosphate aldolase [Methanobrevibacter sp.]
MIKINNAEELANKIDHTNLNNLSKKEDIDYLVKKANEYKFYSVVVSPYYVKYTKEILKDSPTKLVTVAGFPLGFTTPKAKKKEAKIAIKDGIDELDMVVNIQALKARDYYTVAEEIEKVKNVCGEKVLKVIIEAELLNNEEIVKVSEIIANSGADYIKTSTGMSGLSPKISDIISIQKTAPQMKIKASGGIKDIKTAMRLISLGVDRIGTSSGDLIVEEYKRISEKH